MRGCLKTYVNMDQQTFMVLLKPREAVRFNPPIWCNAETQKLRMFVSCKQQLIRVSPEISRSHCVLTKIRSA